MYSPIEFIVYAVIFGLMCALVANVKHRRWTDWLVAGAFLGPIALVAVLAAPVGDPPGCVPCPHCRSAIPAAATVCRYCSRSV
jgi:peptidoglycan/LPS O-acetylase OafA/YrhL